MSQLSTKPGTSLRSLTQVFILCQQTDGKSPHTVKYYDGILHRFLWYAEKDKWPEDAQLISEWQIRELLRYVAGENKRWGNRSWNCEAKPSHSMLRHYYIGLGAFFSWAVREGFLQETPLSNIKVHKAKPRVIQPYTPEEIRAMLKLCDLDYQQGARFLASRNRAIVLVLLDTGLRLSELAEMTLIDIDTNKGWIKVHGKGDKERVVRIGKAAQRALWTYLAWRPEGHRETWLTEERRPLQTRGIQHMIRTLKQRAGIKTGGTVHRFRHSFALNFLRADGNPFNLQALLGHEDLTMVRRYTAALTMEDALEAHVKASPADVLGLK